MACFMIHCLRRKMKIISSDNSDNAPVFIWGEDSTHGETVQELFDMVKGLTDKPFSIASFDVTDWNGQFSPWKAPAVFGNNDFSGNGKSTLNFLEEEFIPKINAAFSKSKIFLAGYSLAGLFSLWALYESDLFDGAVCCSSSLWFENWDTFAMTHEIKKTSHIYMSLGKQESNTKNKIMAKVGERTEQQKLLLDKSPMVKNFIFEWNEGGHFSEPLLRTAKGIAAICELVFE